MAAKSIRSLYARCVAPVLAGVVVLCGSVTLPAAAQTRRIATAAPAAESHVRVTLRVDRAPLLSVLLSIAQKAGLSPIYDASTFPENTPVTLHLRDVSVSEAFEQALSGTGFVAHIRSEGDVAFVREPARQGSGIVTGRVVDAKSRAPIANATILLDGSTKGVPTDDDGMFRISTSADEHTVHVKVVGYARQSKTITVDASKVTTLEFMMMQSTSVLDEVIVTGTVVATERRAIATPITVITGDEIQKRGITRIDQLLRGEVPGVLVSEVGSSAYTNTIGKSVSSTIYARGSASLDGSANPIKTYVDGVELLDAAYLGTIDPQSIERIEIIAGPQAATIYGAGAMGGVMQIFTRKGRGTKATDMTLTLKYGTLESNFNKSLTPVHNHGLNATGGDGPSFSYSGTLSYGYTGQWQPRLFNRTFGGSVGATHTRDRLTLSGSVSATGDRSGTYDGSSGGGLQFSAKAAEGEYTSNYGVTIQFSQQVSTASSQTGAFNVDYRASHNWQHHLTVGRSQNTFTLTPVAPAFKSASDSLFQTSTANGQRTTLNYNTTIIGSPVGMLSSTLALGFTGSSGLRTDVSGCQVTKSATSVVSCFAGGTPSVSTTLNQKSWGGFGSWQLGVADRLYLTLGLRGERNPSYGREHRTDWTPTNGLTYTAELGDLTVKLLGSYGRATRSPKDDYRRERLSTTSGLNVSQYVSLFAAPELTPEYSRGPQGGIELYYGNVGTLTINRYQQTIDNLIQYVLVDSIEAKILSSGLSRFLRQYQYQNVAKIRQYGWESTGSVVLGAVTVKGTYFWNDSRVLAVNPNSTSPYQPGQSFASIPTHAGNFTASYARGGTSISVVNNYIGSVLDPRNAPFWSDRTYDRLMIYLDRRNVSQSPISRPGYIKTDVAMSQRLSRGMSVTFNVVNAGNSFAAQTDKMSPALGRQATLGISLRSPSAR